MYLKHRGRLELLSRKIFMAKSDSLKTNREQGDEARTLAWAVNEPSKSAQR